MVETNELFERVARMQKDIEDLKAGQEDIFFIEKDRYLNRVKTCLETNQNNVITYLEIDGIRSVSEIESDLKKIDKPIAHRTIWNALNRLIKDGLIEKIDQKGKSPVFSKRKWAKTLHIDDYVRSQFKRK